MFRKLRLRLRALFHRNDIGDELRSHLEQLTDELMAQGLPPQEAQIAARRQFGNTAGIGEQSRDLFSFRLLEDCARDLHYAVRMLRKTSLLSMVAIISLALGIGVNTAVWIIYNGALLRPPPLYHDSARLVTIWETPPQEPGRLRPVAAPVEEALRQNTDIFGGVAAVRVLSGVSARFESYPEAVSAKSITSNLLPLLGVEPRLGRNFREGETDATVVLSHRLWKTRYDSSEDALGQTIVIGGVARTVIGVMPERFWFADTGTALWLPLRLDAEHSGPEQRDLLTVARLLPGVTIEQARSRMEGILAQVSGRYPERNPDWGIRLEDLIGARRLQADSPGVLLVAGGVCLVLLIACVNVASVMVGRSIGREKETAVRAALGAGRLRLVSQFFTESLLIAAAGAILAVPVTWAMLAFLFSRFLADFPIFYDFTPDFRVIAFIAGIALLTGIVSGLAPALSQSKADAGRALQQSSRTITPHRQRLRRVLVVLEVGLTLTLIVAAGAGWESYRELMVRDPGFDTRNLLSVRLTIPAEKSAGATAFTEESLRQLRTAHGVLSAGAIGAPPFWEGRMQCPVRIPGHTDAVVPACSAVNPDYFHTLGIPLLRGRAISPQDDEQAAQAVWINESMARRFWPGEDPVGQYLALEAEGDADRLRQIAGIVRNTHNRGIMHDPIPALYIPLQQYPAAWSDSLLRPTIMLRTAVSADQLAPDIRSIIARIEPDQAVGNIAPVASILQTAADEVLASAVIPMPVIAIGLLLSALGVYGVLAFAVSQRTHEIGIRIALGASRGSLIKLILGEGLRLAGIGTAFGIVAAFALTRTLSGLIVPFESAQTAVFVTAAFLLLAVGAVASYFPARRVLRIHPSDALRHE